MVRRVHDVGVLFIMTGLVGMSGACSTPRSDSAPDAVASDAGSDGETDSLVDVTSYEDLLEPGARISFVLASAPGESDLGWSAWDSRFGVGCALSVAEDGLLRCLPSPRVRTSTLYSDSACTEPLLFTYNGYCERLITVPLSESAPAQLPNCAAHLLPTSEITPAVVYRLGDPAPDGTTFFRLEVSPTQGGSDTCVEAGTVGNFAKFYPIGERIPPSEFVEFTLELAD